MNRYWIALLGHLLVFSNLLAADDFRARPTLVKTVLNQNEESAIITGEVTLSDGSALSTARIDVKRYEQPNVITVYDKIELTKEGTFSVKVRPGSYFVSASDEKHCCVHSNPRIDIAAGETKQLNFSMEPFAKMIIKVKMPNGKPASNQVYQFSATCSAKNFTQSVGSRAERRRGPPLKTDDNGSIVLDNVPPLNSVMFHVYFPYSGYYGTESWQRLRAPADTVFESNRSHPGHITSAW